MPSLIKQTIEDNFTRAQAVAGLAKAQRELEEKTFKGATAKDVDTTKSFEQAKTEIEKIPELVIYSAMPLSDDQISDLGRRVREIFKKDLFIDVKLDKQLLGGAAMVWNGKYRDYSLRARFEEKKDILLGIYDQFTEDRRGRIRPKH